MKNWLLTLLMLFAMAGMLQPVQAAETAFYTKSAIVHADGSTASAYAVNEPVTIQINWKYNGQEPAVYKVPDPFKISKDGEQPLKTAEGETIGTLNLNAAQNTATAVLNESTAAGAAGTAVIPASLDKAKLAKTGAQSVQFSTGETISFTVTEASAGAIKLIAIDSDSKAKLSGSTFTVENDSGKIVASLTTNSAGEASVPNLEFGSYTVTQTAAPADYAVPADPWKVELNTVLVTKEVLHEKAIGLTGALNITAVEKNTTTPIEEAVFELKTENGLFSKKVVTDEKGKASLTGLAYGKYTLTQKETDKDYVLPAESWTITIDSQTPVEQKIENALVNGYGTLNITLVDSSSSAALKGAEYSLYNEEKNLVSKMVTDDKGEASFANLKAGSYTLEETKAPDGYTRSTEKPAVTIKSGETVELNLKNTKAAAAAASSTTKTTTTKAAGTLPQTGDESGMMYVFGGVLFAVGALLLMRKGKHA
ncbi:LPXTG cell wall anchor domain-containing protein [Domibacillus indicus]|uniref:LPXTG cell wall anchor domain-containing protein n=1 Tax=Domibacillus indicus TaxID=1437523 RepID=UPI000618335F|nr:LPXTG cell wall anchor domain-containing protein [Domibacillus indicus]